MIWRPCRCPISSRSPGAMNAWFGQAPHFTRGFPQTPRCHSFAHLGAQPVRPFAVFSQRSGNETGSRTARPCAPATNRRWKRHRSPCEPGRTARDPARPAAPTGGDGPHRVAARVRRAPPPRLRSPDRGLGRRSYLDILQRQPASVTRVTSAPPLVGGAVRIASVRARERNPGDPDTDLRGGAERSGRIASRPVPSAW